MNAHTSSHALWPMLVSDHGATLPHGMVVAAIGGRYRQLLLEHLEGAGEQTLFAAYEMGKEMVRAELTPEEAMALHMQAVVGVESADLTAANSVLMEVMTAFAGAMRSMRAAIAADEQMRSSYRKLKHALGDTIEAINAIREARDPQTVAHQRRVTQLAVAIAERLGLEEDRLEGLRVAASLHDVGMMQVPTNALLKPGKLAPDEVSMVQAHPEVGYDMLKNIESPWPIAEITRQHHERVDGRGYPFGLS
ncbi:MAG: HD domain-containing protein, partial [Mariprofundales bacterium]|nr:HD domain-containing protein [Mariprofundales bacterium]